MAGASAARVQLRLDRFPEGECAGVCCRRVAPMAAPADAPVALINGWSCQSSFAAELPPGPAKPTREELGAVGWSLCARGPNRAWNQGAPDQPVTRPRTRPTKLESDP